MRRWLVRLFLLLAVACAAGYVAWSRFGPIEVEVARPVRGPAVEAVYGPGTVEPEVMLPIGPKVSGRIETIDAHEGDEVKSGAVLATLASDELSAGVREMEARVAFAEAQFKRASDLFAKRTGTAAALDEARNALATAKAALDRAREQLAEMSLKSPADGRIIRRDGEIGQLVGPNDTVFWMSCCKALRVAAEIDEEDISAVKPGQQALIRASAFPDKVFKGTVTSITPKGDPVARNFRVRIRLDGPTPLLIGMTADCNIILDTHENALLVPAETVEKGKVFVVEDGHLRERAVRTGISGNGRVEILEGLSETDEVVVHPRDGLAEGRAATIAPNATATTGG
ncbi:Macrolide-specific efflux protein MacA precursor [Hartmannibacter diazotrophicus]|uniref:Macrolide-specific efflux protein MacA n=1 Tax=Hartmannibacter diazotrophicus TaxID=1482074 RepID=A0A2C9DDK6_9HYPH|nr:efflux RND transporter periplasmic adaptor subunit [Hartmannibacter diazotrophicus]SON58333.1 Macrolide-specific efflux protein MacA precursor [Hartmannibacter diazotrophicus]